MLFRHLIFKSILSLFLIFLGFSFVHFYSLPVGAAEPTDFIQTSGQDLVYQGQTVILKGTNFDNVPALGASIGTGNMSSILITEADYQELKAQGGNHARFGLSFNWYQNDPTAFFAMLDTHIEWARANNIWIVLNLFTTPNDCYEGYSAVCGIWTDVAEQEELEAFWVDVATHYQNEPVIAGYGLLNEPNPQDPDYCTTWFNIADTIYQSVHAVAPNQLVFIAACSDPGNSLRYRNPPFGTNIVYEVHDYSPSSMTHDSALTYPGPADAWFGTCTYNQDAFRGIAQLGDPVDCAGYTNLWTLFGLDWADTNNVPMYIGEWGTTSSLTGYVQFHQDKAELFQEWGLNHAQYTWKHNTIVSGGSNQWGIYANTTGITLDDPLKLAAVQVAWTDTVFANFATVSTDPGPSSSSSSNPSNSSSSFSASYPPTCGNSSPAGQPDLFQINRSGSTATLYFTPVNDSLTTYHVVYGYQEGQELFGLLSAPVSREANTGVQSVTISHLNPRQAYWFKVIPVNGCATGIWSNWLKADQGTLTERIFYRYVPSALRELL